MAEFSRRDFLKLGGAAFLGIAAGRFLPLDDEPNFTAPLIWHGSRKFRTIAFTYDDCYLLHRMQNLEALLNRFPSFQVTFFPVGAKILDLERQDPGLWNRLVERGHEIGYHTYDHVNIGVMSPAGAIKDFDKWQKTLNQVLGRDYPVRFVRPTYDIISYTLDVLCQERGLVAALFSIGGGGDPQVVVPAIKKSKGGDIVQMHIRSQDYLSSEQAFPWLLENDWELVTLSRLYDDYLKEKVNPKGCEHEFGSPLARACLD
ncbi:MAG: hypothetical protein FJZ87_04845 [Chloroflexi bacterium]|nr:hypothetical protein [Chloroflexota bacterium]